MPEGVVAAGIDVLGDRGVPNVLVVQIPNHHGPVKVDGDTKHLDSLVRVWHLTREQDLQVLDQTLVIEECLSGEGTCDVGETSGGDVLHFKSKIFIIIIIIK